MGIRYKKNQPKKPIIKLDTSSIGERIKHTDGPADDPKKPITKPTVIKPLLGDFDAIARANTPKNKLPEPTIITPTNSQEKIKKSNVANSLKNQNLPYSKNDNLNITNNLNQDKENDLADIWSTQEKIKLAREAEEKRLKDEKKAQKEAKKLAKKNKKHTNKKSTIFKKPIFNKPTKTSMSNISVYESKSTKFSKRTIYIGIAMLVLPVGLIFTAITINITNNKKPTSGATVVRGQETKKAEFVILTPEGASNATTKYDSERKVVSFADKIAGINVIISQQQLPENFKPAVADNVRKMAEQFYANVPLDIKDGSAFLGTSVKGPQTVIINKNNLIIFIQSEKQIDAKDWVNYINTLKLAS